MEVIIGICLAGFPLIAFKLGALFDSMNDLSLKKENKTQGNMAKASGVTEVTIRNRVRDLGKNLNLPAALVESKQRHRLYFFAKKCSHIIMIIYFFS